VPLVTSLLTAIVRADGDALVLHAGERPYIVTPTGRSELASRALTLEAVKGMLNELLSTEAHRSLAEFGAVQHDLGSPAFAKGESFDVVAARGGDDIWIEIRRRRIQVGAMGATGATGAARAVDGTGATGATGAIGAVGAPGAADAVEPVVPVIAAAGDAREPVAAANPVPEPAQELEAQPHLEGQSQIEAEPQSEPSFASIDLSHNLDSTTVATPMLDIGSSTQIPEPQGEQIQEPEPDAWNLEPEARAWSVEPGTVDVPSASSPAIEQIHEVEQESFEIGTAAEVHEISADVNVSPIAYPAVEPTTIAEPSKLTVAPPRPSPIDDARPSPDLGRSATDEGRSAVVLPLSRPQVRGDQNSRFTPSLQTTGIDRLLRIAAARGASTLYLTSQARPSIRVDGEISAIEGEATLTEGDVESLILDMIPERNREALRSQAGTEWICDVPDVGRIRCVTFRDHRGAGGIFRMIPARAISAEQLGLSREIQNRKSVE
jgi:hypothetical protein